jgi:hypothetical protein
MDDAHPTDLAEGEDWGATPHAMDAVEDVLDSLDWVYDRRGEAEAHVRVEGRACRYEVVFAWDGAAGILRCVVRFDLRVPRDRRLEAAAVAADLTANLDIGHFAIGRADGAPRFVHACLLSGVGPRTRRAHVQTMLQAGFRACEGAFPAFALLADTGAPLSARALSLAVMRTAGQA